VKLQISHFAGGLLDQVIASSALLAERCGAAKDTPRLLARQGGKLVWVNQIPRHHTHREIMVNQYA
jgi:hypothetical protein